MLQSHTTYRRKRMALTPAALGGDAIGGQHWLAAEPECIRKKLAPRNRQSMLTSRPRRPSHFCSDPDPRVISSEVSAKLLLADLNFETADLPETAQATSMSLTESQSALPSK
jgi:hypothetical protein